MHRLGFRTLSVAFALALLVGSTSRAQAPQVDVDNPPGVPEGVGRLGPPIGSSGTSSFDANGVNPLTLGGRPGASAGRAPIGEINATPKPMITPANIVRPQLAPPPPPPAVTDHELPTEAEDPGPADGLTLDGAIDILLRNNLNLIALHFEIPMAQADVLTASLRANPIFYADSQLVPYGRYSNARPGGQTQYDVNVTFPLDVWRKRVARTEVACRAKKVTEAQFQDAVRQQIDNLYTAYVDVVAAHETLRYANAYLRGISRLLELNRDLLQRGQVTPSTVDALKAQVEQAQYQVREAKETLYTNTRALAVLLNLTPAQAEELKLRGQLRDVEPLPTARESLTRLALESRPDLNSYRLGLSRAKSDVKLARANRYSDVYLLAQPYTYQDNRPFGLKSPTSWAVGVTVGLPVFNRNQGNIQRAQLNVKQTEVELQTLERQIVFDVEKAIREFELSRVGVLEYEKEILPASRRVRETAFNQFRGGEISALDFLEAQRGYNEVVRDYRNSLVRHRRAMLDLNTSVGSRIIP
jgi:cobalt-zinc-cadmium efflux system outer membrane protein